MQPNFETMTTQELKKYALSHRNEVEALRELYRRRTPDSEAVWFSPPQTKQEEEHQWEMFKSIIEEKQTTIKKSEDD